MRDMNGFSFPVSTKLQFAFTSIPFFFPKFLFPSVPDPPLHTLPHPNVHSPIHAVSLTRYLFNIHSPSHAHSLTCTLLIAPSKTHTVHHVHSPSHALSFTCTLLHMHSPSPLLFMCILLDMHSPTCALC